MTMRRRLLPLVALVALVLGACFKTDAKTVVAGDGSAASRISIELDLGLFEDMFGAFADGFADEFGDDVGEQPSISEQMQESADEMNAELDALYAEHPELRDRVEMSVSVDDDTFKLEMAVVTDTAAQLEALYDSFLGSGDADFRDIVGVDAQFGDPTEELTGGGDSGIFSSVSVSMDDRFEFRAESMGAGLSSDDGFGDMSGLFAGFAPEINIEITAPGDIISTNGDRNGRTVSWELDGTEAEGLELVSEIDPSATIDGLASLGSTGGDDDSGFPIVLVLIIVAIVAGVGVALYLRSRNQGDGEPVAPTPSEFPAASTAPSGPPSAPPPPADSTE